MDPTWWWVWGWQAVRPNPRDFTAGGAAYACYGRGRGGASRQGPTVSLRDSLHNKLSALEGPTQIAGIHAAKQKTSLHNTATVQVVQAAASIQNSNGNTLSTQSNFHSGWDRVQTASARNSKCVRCIELRSICIHGIHILQNVCSCARYSKHGSSIAWTRPTEGGVQGSIRRLSFAWAASPCVCSLNVCTCISAPGACAHLLTCICTRHTHWPTARCIAPRINCVSLMQCVCQCS